MDPTERALRGPFLARVEHLAGAPCRNDRLSERRDGDRRPPCL